MNATSSKTSVRSLASGPQTWIVGAGMTGLAAGITTHFPVLESLEAPGGVCASYRRQGYHFEVGGGHSIFGGDPAVLHLLSVAGQLRCCCRLAAVHFLGNHEDTRDLRHRFVPFPIQDNLFALPREFRQAALSKLLESPQDDSPATMDRWLKRRFGLTLYRIFFAPFHLRYTAGLFEEIAPQDAYKSPVDLIRVRGTRRETTGAGYNATFVYPTGGLDVVSQWLAARCEIRYGSAVVSIDTGCRTLALSNGTILPYQTLVVTAPLHRIIEMAELEDRVGPPDPFTSVLVLNLAATLPNTRLARHRYHWLNIPDSRSGFYRVGYYSNVDTLFLPAQYRGRRGHAALYVEMAFPVGARPNPTGVHNTGITCRRAD